MQVALDARKGDANHRHVESVEEQHAAEHEERRPAAPVEPVRGGLCGE